MSSLKSIGMTGRLMVSVLLFCSMVLNGYSQEKAVPASVKKSFKKAFRSAESVSWYVERQDYEAQFLDDDIEKVAYYSKSDGAYMGVKELIPENMIPSTVMGTVRKSYPGFVLQEYYKMMKVSGDTTYVVGVDIRGEIFTLQMNANGEILKKELSTNN